MTAARLTTVAVGATVAVLLATAAHEATHAATVHLVGGRVDHVHWWPPNAAVVFEAPDRQADALVRLAPAAVSIPLAVAGILLLSTRRLEWQLVGAAFIAAYLPRSETDWAPVVAALKSVSS